MVADPTSVAARIAARSAARRRQPDYESEVQSLLEAARNVVASTGKARVADIVAEAGLSNDAFYRHFPSKQALVSALVEEGAERVATATARKMASHDEPEAKVRCWLDAMLGRTKGRHAADANAVFAISDSGNSGLATGDHAARLPLAELLHEPFRALGSADPVLDAELVTHAVSNRVAGHLRAGTTPTPPEAEHLLRFCLTTARTGATTA